ncbi:hypothetical protein [Pseudochrobactrum asaccharolyticum]|uniref:His/Glu/Gln/Arg/opine family amino acid ABC transporter permease subunit n=1 Tax=Pseudochrobactrum asaccharolyticum TaxID=354351 RepID=A0A366E4C6_9HYPH|nr:hypothetical protein [Pseudochrobactrum asaccharolyticum]MBX8802007.1 hypothetical protein [Ochrobactrum sp. MR28]MBX8817709.1 hypothetical protein [Ochrobactrum sp. MR31]RBO97231.1 His/Glu/Gln/Arg/opine family amino acid ABC transporter permease subunit [Pseudochrobactrum asaccharolyticum]
MDQKPQHLTSSSVEKPPKGSAISWMDIGVAFTILAIFALIVFNINSNMIAAGIQPGFSFLTKQAGFDLAESLISYNANDSYLRAIFAGLVNTIVVAAVSLIIACLVGLVIGLLSVSNTRITRLFALAYVELFRNMPKLLVLLTGSAEFSLQSGEWETKGKYCEPSTLPKADQERTEAPIYARSSLGETAREIEANETTQAAESARVLQMLDDLGKSPHIENQDMQEPTAQQSTPPQSHPSTQAIQADAASPSSNSHMPLRGKSIALSSTDEAVIREAVSLNLADETSARFRNIAAVDMEDGTYIVCGFVNGKNQFGAYTGYQIFYGVYRPVDPIFVTKYIIKPSFGLSLCVASGGEFKH